MNYFNLIDFITMNEERMQHCFILFLLLHFHVEIFLSVVNLVQSPMILHDALGFLEDFRGF